MNQVIAVEALSSDYYDSYSPVGFAKDQADAAHISQKYLEDFRAECAEDGGYDDSVSIRIVCYDFGYPASSEVLSEIVYHAEVSS